MEKIPPSTNQRIRLIMKLATQQENYDSNNVLPPNREYKILSSSTLNAPDNTCLHLVETIDKTEVPQINIDADTLIKESESHPNSDNVFPANNEHDIPSSSILNKPVTKSSDSLSDSDSQIDDSDADPNYSTTSISTTASSDSETENKVVSISKIKDTKNEEAIPGKKRKANPGAWKKEIAKRCRNSGMEYTSTSKSKKLFKAKKLGPPCNEKCKLQCYSKFSNEDRQSIFSDYWNLADLQRQRNFLLNCMEAINPKYQYKRINSNRTCNHAFYFLIGEKKIRVCKSFFKSTLAITDRPIRTVIKKQTCFTKGIITSEARGKHGHHYHIDNDIKESVRRHIKSIPRIESHYCRSESTREYIEGSKTLAQLHRDYIKTCEYNNEPYANYIMYSRIFNTEYNISFFKPKKDQCADCVSFEIASSEEKQNLRADYETHILEKDLSRMEKNQDKENNKENLVVAVYDLQAVLQCPRGDTSEFYYVSKLNVFNFTIYELKTKAAFCYMWDESEGNRGVCEIGTCVLSYLESLADKAKNLENKKLDVIFYSDNCCGQQKNHVMFAMYLFAVQKYDFINSITHKFLIKGHSQNEGDSVHSLIERQVKRSLRSGPIFVPDQYMTLVRTSKVTGKPYEVHEMNHESFLDLKSLATTVGKNFSKNTKNELIKMANFKVIKTEKEHPNKLFYKTSYADEFQTIEVKLPRQSKTRISDINEDTIKIKNLYKTKPGISEKKKASILSLFKQNTKTKHKNVIPMYYYNYYNSL